MLIVFDTTGGVQDKTSSIITYFFCNTINSSISALHMSIDLVVIFVDWGGIFLDLDVLLK